MTRATLSPVILSEAKNLSSHTEILRFAQNDRLRGWSFAKKLLVQGSPWKRRANIL